MNSIKAIHTTLPMVALLAALTLLPAMAAHGETPAPIHDGCYALNSNGKIQEMAQRHAVRVLLGVPAQLQAKVSQVV